MDWLIDDTAEHGRGRHARRRRGEAGAPLHQRRRARGLLSGRVNMADRPVQDRSGSVAKRVMPAAKEISARNPRLARARAGDATTWRTSPSR